MLGRAFASVALGIGLAAACLVSPTVASADITTAKSRKVAPTFTLKDAKGAPVSLTDYKGKVVLLISGPRGVMGVSSKFRGSSSIRRNTRMASRS